MNIQSADAKSGWGQALAINAALSLIAWRAYVAMKGDELHSHYRFGSSGSKYLIVSFLEPFTLFILVPLLVVGLLSLTIGVLGRRADPLRSYKHGLIAAGIWLTLGLAGLWYGQT